ncbi:hypothetical protein Areg01_82110 [Actinoplanes regularis]|nr:hypothetical protein Areg01_82110 [Actinoplanes regularis]
MHLYGYDPRSACLDEWLDPEKSMARRGLDLAAAEDLRIFAESMLADERDHPYPSANELAVDGSPLLERPEFWPAHLCSTTDRDADVPSAFGLSWDEVRETGLPPLKRLDQWPVFTIPLHGGAVLVIIHRTHHPRALYRGKWVQEEAEHQIDFWLAPATGEGMLLGSVQAGPTGPGLRWPELKGIAQAAAPDRREIARRLLLLAPILGDKEMPDQAVTWFAQALSILGGLDRNSWVVCNAAEGIAFGNELFRYATWRQEDGIWVCDGIDSSRSPDPRIGLLASDLRRAAEILRPLGEEQ